MKCGICKKILNSKVSSASAFDDHPINSCFLKAALKRHKLLVHDKKKNLLCDFCPRFFGEKSNLMRHILKSHKKEMNESGVKIEPGEEVVDDQEMFEKVETTFECGFCGKLLTTKWGLF
jgi:hypothetical protein